VWADNETDEDLLGFDFVVDSLIVSLTEPRLLPLTIGLLGDWGSGKSSVLKIVQSELEALPDRGDPDDSGDETGRYVCVEFSPWQYEDYDDVKVSLMNAVLDRLYEETTSTEQQQRLSFLRRHAQSLRRRGRALGRLALTAAPAVTTAAAGMVDPALASPEVVEVGRAMAGAAVGAAEQALQDPDDTDIDAGNSPVADVAAFKMRFAELLTSLEHVDAVVVLLDDLDRCLPESVVDTFEAIRLFLNTPKTAFVVAAHQLVVESAIDTRYPELRRPDGHGIGRDYLEKMLQLKVAIPALSAAEAETYMNLLLAELHLDEQPFAAVLDVVRQRRTTNPLTVGFNLGVAEDCLGADQIPRQLVHDLNWAAGIAPALAGGLRGNPRQLKRFLNIIMLRARSARRRRVTLDLGVVAKLLVLEEQHFGDFKKLFDWQMASAGVVEQLGLAEANARTAGQTRSEDGDQPITDDDGTEGDGTPGAARLPSEVQEWLSREHVRTWLRLEPALARVDLRPYFTYSRDKLSLGVVAMRLAPQLQELLADLQSDLAASRRAALAAVATLGPEEQDQVVQALLDAVTRTPGGPAIRAAAELAGRVPQVVQTTCDTLMRVPLNAVEPPRALTVIRYLPRDHPAVAALIDRWQRSGVPALESVVTTALAQATRARG
jgi:KAP family P-loop domain